MTKYRKGDVVTIEATISGEAFEGSDGEGRVQIRFPPYHDVYVNPAQLSMKRPLFQVGDRVACTPGDIVGRLEGTVISIHDEHAWVDFEDGSFATWWLPKCERVDVDEAEDVMNEEIAADDLRVETEDAERQHIETIEAERVAFDDGEDRSGETV